MIEVRVPGLLRDSVGGQSRLDIEAATLQDALTNLLERYPLLRTHLYDETGKLRPHVLLYYNDQNLAWLGRLDAPLAPGDKLTILQAVSGG